MGPGASGSRLWLVVAGAVASLAETTVTILYGRVMRGKSGSCAIDCHDLSKGFSDSQTRGSMRSQALDAVRQRNKLKVNGVRQA